MSLSLASAADPGGAASPITRCPEKKQMLIQSHKLTKFSEVDVFRGKVVKRGKEDEVMRGEGVWEEAVDKLKYLGLILSADGGTAEEVIHRFVEERKVWGTMDKL